MDLTLNSQLIVVSCLLSVVSEMWVHFIYDLKMDLIFTLDNPSQRRANLNSIFSNKIISYAALQPVILNGVKELSRLYSNIDMVQRSSLLRRDDILL